MMSPVTVPAALLEGFATVWCRLAGGDWRREDTGAGALFVWSSPDGRSESLPDRMYGLASATTTEVDVTEFPSGVAVNLPPGVMAEGAVVHAVGHQLAATSREEAWDSLRRVGRQGVHKARRVGCQVAELSGGQYHALAEAKATRMQGRAPHPDLVPALRDVFGDERVGLSGVTVDGDPAAAVLWLHVEGYGMLVDGTSDRAHWDKNPNNLAVWTAVGTLMDAGCHRVDFGFSAPGAGDLRFKDHMGGREVALYRVDR